METKYPQHELKFLAEKVLAAEGKGRIFEELDTTEKTVLIDAIERVLDNQLAMPADIHESWVDDMTKDGWKYGEELDLELKTHPLMVPYSQLPETVRLWEENVLIATVDAFRHMVPAAQQKPDEKKVPEMTLGQFRVGVNFNPAKKTEVDDIKEQGAHLIDYLEAQKSKVDRKDPLCGEKLRLIAHAQTLIEDACMNGVKAVTKNTNVVIQPSIFDQK